MLLLRNIVHWRLRYFWKFLLSLRNCIYLVNKLNCNFAFSVETFGTMKNCVFFCFFLFFLKTVLSWKTALLGNCVTWKLCCSETVLLEKLRYFVKLRYLKTVLLWKTVLLLKNCVTWKTALLWKLCYLINCVALKNCVTLGKLRYLKNCVTW